MSRSIFLACLFFPHLLFGQADLKEVRKESHEVFAYKVNTSAAEKFILKDSISVDAFLSVIPDAVFPVDSAGEKNLALGHYVLLTIKDNRIIANLIGVSDLSVYPVNNQQHVQLVIINKRGDFVNDARVWVNGKEAVYKTDAQSYLVKQKNPDNALVKIYAQHDTLFSSLSAKDEVGKPVMLQKWDNFKRSGFFKTIRWLPLKIKNLFQRRNYYRQYTSCTTGMIVFNQPKYKKTDTVKLKAYVFNKKWRTYSKPVNVFLEYYSAGRSSKVFLKKIEPSSPGSYVFQFPLSDTLQADINYTVDFRANDDKRIVSKSFRIEDYLLDEISSYNLRSARETYYPDDTLHFYASANNANGQSLLDGSAQLVLTTATINRFYHDSMYVPDTLFAQKKSLVTNGETKFDFPASGLPDADLNIKAAIIFRNGNNETQEKSINVSYRMAEKELTAFIEKDSAIAIYRENGKIVPAMGTMHVNNEWGEIREVHYPFKIKINGFVSSYSFYLLKDEKIVDSAQAEIDERYDVILRRISRGDTLGFVLDNPFSIPVSFTVFDGNKIIGAGKSNKPKVFWETVHPNMNRAYRVSWQYYWKGEEKNKEQSIALLYKLLNIEIKSNQTVFPGQKDTITVSVKDYKNNPVEAVNLTAVCYNNQFNKDIYVQDPPYLVKYKMRSRILRDKYEEEDGYILRKYPLGMHISWIKKFGLDSMLYYKMLFPKNGVLDAVTPISEFLPQLSVHVAEKGERKEIYLLYINRNLVYYNGVTEKMKDAYQAYPGFAQIGIRLFDKLIEIDSIYIQPSYKHDLFFDLNNLPAHTKITQLSDSLTADERSLLENSLWRLDNNYKTNDGYVWQQERLVRLSEDQEHIIGPFRFGDSLHYFKPKYFDIHFIFEPGYQYSLSRQMVRLEKKSIFPYGRQSMKLKRIESADWVLGDTVKALPVISYTEPIASKPRYLTISQASQHSYDRDGNGKLSFTVVPDTVLDYVILYPAKNPGAKRIMPGNSREIANVNPGEYTLMLVDKTWKSAAISHMSIKPHHTYCVHIDNPAFGNENALLAEWENETFNPEKNQVYRDTLSRVVVQDMPEYQSGKAGITGRVTDQNGGHGIPGASISIKGSKTGTSTKPDGTFIINNIKPGKCTLVIASVGYIVKQVSADVPDNGFININILLAVSSQSLQEVVVTGYGASSKKDLTYSISTIKDDELSQVIGNRSLMLQGRVSGVQITNEGEPGSSSNIMLRGISTLSAGQHPLFIIDGIMYDEMPANISPDMIASADVLKGAEATNIYGSKGANGVVVISTKTKNLRTQFRDYAFWQPELFTDKDGRVKFSVEYPDNVTGWQTYILGMDKKRRMGKSFSFIKSYKPLMAQISTPQFLIVGDTVEIIGKSLNYSNDDYSVKPSFIINGQSSVEKEIILKSQESGIGKHTLITPSMDTLETSFHIETSTGFKDGEEKKIPVFQKGSLEAKGHFWVLDKDTTVSFKPVSGSTRIECYAQNNTLDILLDEIDFLKKYPYYCMEQTASKLRGLLTEKKIREKLNQKFEEDKTIHLLEDKLQKNQLFDGGWGWWENGKANLFITNYVINALLQIRSEGMIETNIRNGLLFLQNQLPALQNEELLSALLTMSEAKHLINYQTWLSKIDFDSLNIHQQWEFVKIMQSQHIEYSSELNKLMRKGIHGVLGSLHWGDENYRWYSDADATTVVAFEVLEKEKNSQRELNSIVQYFLEQRRTGHWHNTVASASIVSALLPYVLSSYKDFNQPAVLTITGDTSFTISQYPFKLVMHNPNAKEFNINKTGGGLTYLTFYQQSWTENPEPIDKYFDIHSYFEKDGQKVSYLYSGQKIKMIVEVNALRASDYVMAEIPIPAGCVYASKVQDDLTMHKEFLKNKVIIFSEKMNAGVHYFEVELESRYNGIFTLNPAKISLMYFPVFYGRNGMKEIEIKPEKTE